MMKDKLTKEELIDKINGLLDDDIIEFDAPMKNYTTFKLGGPADVLVKPQSMEQLKTIVQFCVNNDVNYIVLGRGSNVLVGDKGFRGVVILLAGNFSDCEVDGNVVKAQAGILLSKMANIVLDNGLAGFEFASGIPGTLGGAIYMNAGAYGGEIKDVIKDATILTKDGEFVTLSKDEMQLGYRTSYMMDNKAVVLKGTFCFEKGNKKDIRAKMNELNSRRKEKQPLEFPSAGSVFKRPTGYYAGKLIMDSELGGYRIGGVSVSKKHCGFIINDKNGTSKDVVDLINHIKNEVYSKFGVMLECEVRMIGEF